MHPIVAQMHPSPEQQPAILERGRDVVVTASAGTGKTRTLVARYLSLLAEGYPLRGIVAITFTIKAAREMRNRVREEIRLYLARDDVPWGERALWQERYAALDAARISTIHSLCAEILRAYPAEAGVDPRFGVLEEGQQNVVRGRVLDETLAWAGDQPDVVPLFLLLGERGLRQVLHYMVQSRFDVQQILAAQPQEMRAVWGQILSRRQEQGLGSLLDSPDWVDAVTRLQENIPASPDDRMALQRAGALAALQGATGSLAKRLASLSCLGAINLSGGSSKAWPGGKPQMDDVKDALKTVRALWRESAALLELALNPLDDALAQALPQLYAAFAFACNRYDAYKRERHALDFDDLEHRALALLQNNDAVRRRWQQEVRAILVDEFQDTNARQRDLVNCLNGAAHKLFLVGDAKQSIYRFRGADVTVFRAERERIARTGGAAFELTTSYRAHEELIQGLNDLLRPVLGDQADPQRPWVEPFSPLGPHRVRPDNGLPPPHIELHLTVGAKSAGALDRAADALVGRLVEVVQSGGQVFDAGANRALTNGDIAILCRASRAFAPYEDALERAGVPFLTVAGRGFFGRPEVRDLYNALQAISDPTDDLALVGLLRSPVMGVTDATLFHLCHARDEQARASNGQGWRPIWDTLPQAASFLSHGPAAAIERAWRLIAAWHEQVGRTSVADLLKAFLDATDYRAALIRSGQSRGARNVDKLLADAHASGIVSVGEFLEYVSGLRDSGTRDGEARATSEGAVQLMTIHAAKGLEFPVIVVGDAAHAGGGSSSALVDPELGLLLPLKDDAGGLSAVYGLGQALHTDQDAAESDRLFYVAATRAREKLLFSGVVGLDRNSALTDPGGWLGKLSGFESELAGLELPYDENGASAAYRTLRVGETPVTCVVYEPGFAWPHRPRQAPPVQELPVVLPPPLLAPLSAESARVDQRTRDQERIPPQRVWRVVPAVQEPRAPAWVVGSLVHAALAVWRFPQGEAVSQQPSARPSLWNAADFATWAAARARGYGITDQRQLADAVRQCRQLLARFRRHALFYEMEAAERRLHEISYSLPLEVGFDNGIIDALFLRNGLWTVVEFKTDHVRDRSDLDRLLAKYDYRNQAQRYTAAVEQLLGQRPRCLLCLLNHSGRIALYRPKLKDP